MPLDSYAYSDAAIVVIIIAAVTKASRKKMTAICGEICFTDTMMRLKEREGATQPQERIDLIDNLPCFDHRARLAQISFCGSSGEMEQP